VYSSRAIQITGGSELPDFGKRFAIPILILALFLVSLVFLGTGAVQIPLKTTIKILFSQLPGTQEGFSDVPPTFREIIWFIRLPRLVLAMVVGVCLAVAGTIFQGLFRNPMADPYVIGASSGAALGATASMVLAVSWTWMGLGSVSLAAFLGALVTVIVVYNLARVGNVIPVQNLLLAGIAVSAFLSSLVSLLMYFSDDRLHAVVYWLMGGLSGRSWDYVMWSLPYLVVGVGLAIYCARDLNVMLLGEEAAEHLGVEVETSKRILLVAASVLTAIAVAASGIIGFVGLIVPHVVRILIGPDHWKLIPAAGVAGAILVVLADLAARTLLAPVEIPLGVVTSLFGAPFFIYLLRRHRRTYFS